MPLAEIQALLTSIKTATELAQLIRGAGLSLKEATHKMELADLIAALAEAKIKAAEIQELILERDQRIRELQQATDINSRLKYQAPFYWLLPLEGDQADGPFCQQCRDKDGKLIRLQAAGDGVWECKTCQNVFSHGSFERQPHVIADFDPRGY
jgi:hypothetical protein